LRAATAEFAEFGYHGARTARIARAAGVNKQLLFYYFGSKAGLYAEAVRAAASILRRSTSGPAKAQHAGAGRVRSRVERIADACEERPQLVRLVLGSSGGPEDAAELAQGFLQELADDLAREISAGQGLGFFRDDADPQLVALQALTLVLGLFLLPLPSVSVDALERRRRWNAVATDWVIRTLSW
jgi:AcrR family transcriptional regulator